MKIRNGFVSNSSTSSFLIKKELLTEEQEEKIRNYLFTAIELGMRGMPELTPKDMEECREIGLWKYYEKNPDKANDMWCYANWQIGYVDVDGEEYLDGFSVIDNIGMYELFELIGIDNSNVKWE